MKNKSLQRKLALIQIYDCLKSIYDNGIDDRIGLQEAVDCQVEINRIVFAFNHL